MHATARVNDSREKTVGVNVERVVHMMWCLFVKWIRHQGHEEKGGHFCEINTMCLICISQGRQIRGAIFALQFLSQFQFLFSAICHSRR